MIRPLEVSYCDIERSVGSFIAVRSPVRLELSAFRFLSV
jgi:hypothetical protein